MKNKDRVPLFVVFLMGCISMLLIAADTVQPGKPISQYPRATDFQGTDIFIIARTNVSPATNLGVTGNILSNFIATVVTNNIKLVPGTNVTITTNVSSGVITYTISVTNAGNLTTLSNNLVALMTNHVLVAGTNIVITSNLVGNVYTWTIATVTNITGSGGDSVWTNNGTIVFTKASGSVVTNSIQIYTNGALTLGVSTIAAYGGGLIGQNSESLVSIRNVTNEIDFNEIFLGVQGNTNKAEFDVFVNPGLVRSFHEVHPLGGTANIIDEYVDDATNFVFRAYNTTMGDVWYFDPVGGFQAYYFNTSPRTLATNEVLAEFDNNFTNMMILWGDGKLAVQSQITNYFLSTNKFVMTDVGKGLVSSQFGEDDFNQVASTNYVNCQITNYVAAVLQTNFINLSVQAAKLPGNDNPAVGSGYKNWELIYYKTNSSGSIAALSANWQFVVPPDYATNSLLLYMQQMILQTNGVNSSNTIFAASVFKSTPGDSVDIHTNLIFNSEVRVTNTWTASTSGTNILQTSLFSFGANAPIQAGDFAVLNLKRAATNDTYLWEAAVVGLQFIYRRQ